MSILSLLLYIIIPQWVRPLGDFVVLLSQVCNAVKPELNPNKLFPISVELKEEKRRKSLINFFVITT